MGLKVLMQNVDTALVATADPLSQVYEWIVQGAAEHQIVDAIAKTWPDEEARPLIVPCMKKIAKNAEADPEAVRGWCFEATRYLYQQSIAAGNFAVALKAIKMLHDMAGVE
jgi:hypothetical protein